MRLPKLVAGLMCVAWFGSSCATQTLWLGNDGGRHKPADQPYLFLYRPKKTNDVLVVYDEIRERDNMRKRRSYFLIPNLGRVEDGRRPNFVARGKYTGMQIIPLIKPADEEVMKVLKTNVYATTTNQGHQFSLHIDSRVMGPFALPVYETNDAADRTKRILLTPFAMAADAATGAAIAAALAAAGVAGARGGSFP